MSRLTGSDILGSQRDKLGNALEDQMRRQLAPDSRKSDRPLRRFSTREVADITLRMNYNTFRHHLKSIEGMPEGELEPGNRRSFSLEEVHEIQKILAKNGKLPQKSLPWKMDGEQTSVILTYNLKGGVSKTTLAANLAQFLACRGFRVCLVDLDPQSSLSDLFDVRADLDDIPSIYDVLKYDTEEEQSLAAAEVLQATYFPNIDILPGSISLTEFEYETAQAAARGVPFFRRLHDKLEPIHFAYDVILFDTPPHLSFSVIAAIYASTGMLIPLSAGMLDVVSLEKFLDLASSTIESIEGADPDKKFDFVRYVLTRYQPSDPAQLQLSSFLRHTLGEAMLASDMLSSTAIADAGNTMNPLLEIDPSEFTRKTYDRIFESLHGIARELEAEIMVARGRYASIREAM